MATRILSKQRTQALIKELRSAGYSVEKVYDGFYNLNVNGEDLFTAMIGSRGYLVRWDDRLITEVQQ